MDKLFLDNIVFSIQKFGGTTTYWTELLKRYVSNSKITMVSQNQNRIITDLLNNNYSESTTPNRYLLETLLPASILRYLPLTIKLPARAVYHNSYYRTSLQKNIVKIFTIHDFTHKKGLASKFPRNLIHINLTALGLKNADGIICISENTKKDLLYFYPNLVSKNIKVIYHGVNEEFTLLPKSQNIYIRNIFNLNETYILFIGKREGYKNFDLLVDALKDITDVKLVFVGGEFVSDEYKNKLDKNLPGGYIHLNGLSTNEINLLYNYALALIYPSLYEGFGFPVVEAMRSGCPVITTNLSSIPEVGGDAVLYLNEISATEIRNSIEKVKDPEYRTYLINKGLTQSQKFSWDKCAAETFSFYEDTYRMKYAF